MRRLWVVAKFLGALILVFLMLVWPGEALFSAQRAMRTWAYSVGPSLFPFLAPDEIGRAEIDDLEALFADADPFDFMLAAVAEFPGVWYLAPEPAESFRALTRSVVARYPDCPPYGGVHGSVITPHLTVAQSANPVEFATIGAELKAACTAMLPIRSRAQTVLLMHNVAGEWTVRRSFRLGRG